MALDTNLVSHHLLGVDATDETSTHDGTNVGGIHNGDNTSFDGTDSYISIPDNIISDDADYTISLWVNMSSTQTGVNSRFISLIGTSSNIQLGAYLTGEIFIRDNSSTVQTSPSTISMDTLHHVVVVNDSGSKSIYLNKTSKIATAGGVTADATFSAISSGYLTTLYSLTGDISNVRIYNVKKIQTDVDELFNEGYNPSSTTTDVTASVTITATPLTQPITADVTASVGITATPLIKSYYSLFTVVQEIQQTSPETIFRVIQEIEQPITTTIIQRVNV